MQRLYRDAMVAGRAGQIADNSRDNDIITLINQNPQAAQVDTLKVDTAVNGHEYTWVIEGVTITYTADASATKPECSAGIKAAIDAEPLVSGLFSAVDDGVDTVTLTAVFGGVGWTMTTADANLTAATTTANAAADAVGMGVSVVGDTNSDRYGRIAKTANLSAKVITLTPAVTNSISYNVGVRMPDGTEYWGNYIADGSATAKEIVEGVAAAINGSMPASTVIASEDDAVLTLTGEVAGLYYEVLYDGSDWAYAATTDTAYCDLNKVMRGVSVLDLTHEVASDGTISYEANSAMACMHKGRIIVATEQQVAYGDPVYVRLSGTGTIGGFAQTLVAGEHVRLMKASWQKSFSSSLAVLELNLD